MLKIMLLTVYSQILSCPMYALVFVNHSFGRELNDISRNCSRVTKCQNEWEFKLLSLIEMADVINSKWIKELWVGKLKGLELKFCQTIENIRFWLCWHMHERTHVCKACSAKLFLKVSFILWCDSNVCKTIK